METLPYYASIGRRIVAMLLDALVLAIPVCIFDRIIPIAGGLIAILLYAPILESSYLQATVGKYWMGILVTDTQGKRISFQAALIRNIVKIFSSAILFIGHFFAFFNGRKQALHDMLADTLVIYGRHEQPIVAAWTDSFKRLVNHPPWKGQADKYSKLEQLQKLREKGTITEGEFQAEKAKILETKD